MTTAQILPVSSGTGFTDVYTASSTALGTKMLIQNLSSSALLVCLHSTPQENGIVLLPFEQFIIPAGSLGCFVKTTTGYGGVVAVELGAWNALGAPIDYRVYTGLKGLTTQSFIEANVKNGTQWEVSFESNSVASGASVDSVMQTGDQYVLIKSRLLHFTGSEIESSVYRAPAYTGGTQLPIYNLNTVISGSPLAIMKAGVVVSNVGTEIAAKTHAYGTNTNVNQAVGSFDVEGVERVLAPNTAYLLRVVNQSDTSIKLSGYITFYEGEISSLN